MTDTTTAATTVEHIDPKTLVLGENVRKDARLTPEFVASIKELGVLQPITAQRRADGTLTVRYGQRRTLAAVEAGLTLIPVLIVQGDDDEAERIVAQMAENDHRAGMLDSERVAAVEQLSMIGLTAEQIAGRMHRPTQEVRTALRVAQADRAKDAMDGGALTLDQAALLAEFDGDEETTTRLRQAFEQGSSGEHVAERARQDAALAAAVEALTADLTEAGVRVVPPPAWEDKTVVPLSDFADGNNPTERLSVQAHASCPGHVAWVKGGYGGKVSAGYGCDAHQGRHRRFRHASTDTQSPEERRETRENNAAWRAATEVRQAWIKRELFASKKMPKDGERFIAQAIADQMVGDMGERYYALTGTKRPSVRNDYEARSASVESLGRASATRALIAALGMAVAKHEQAAEQVTTWRHAGTAMRRYFAALKAWGYELAPIEETVLARK